MLRLKSMWIIRQKNDGWSGESRQEYCVIARISIRLKGKFDKTAIKLAMPYNTKFWTTKKQHVHVILNVVEISVLKWMGENTR